MSEQKYKEGDVLMTEVSSRKYQTPVIYADAHGCLMMSKNLDSPYFFNNAILERDWKQLPLSENPPSTHPHLIGLDHPARLWCKKPSEHVVINPGSSGTAGKWREYRNNGELWHDPCIYSLKSLDDLELIEEYEVKKIDWDEVFRGCEAVREPTIKEVNDWFDGQFPSPAEVEYKTWQKGERKPLTMPVGCEYCGPIEGKWYPTENKVCDWSINKYRWPVIGNENLQYEVEQPETLEFELDWLNGYPTFRMDEGVYTPSGNWWHGFKYGNGEAYSRQGFRFSGEDKDTWTTPLMGGSQQRATHIVFLREDCWR